jgi:hypothetical protein
MVNDEPIWKTRKMYGLQFIPLKDLLNRYVKELPGRKIDIDFIMKSGLPSGWQGDDLQTMIDKYERLKERVQLLAKCYKMIE